MAITFGSLRSFLDRVLSSISFDFLCDEDYMHRRHTMILQELPEIEPVMAYRLHARYDFVHPVFVLQLIDPGSERLEPFLGVTEPKGFSEEFVSSPFKSSCEVCFTTDINANDQSFSVIAVIVEFCVIDFIWIPLL